MLIDIDGVLVDHRSAADKASYLWASTLPGWELGPQETADLWEALDRKHFLRYQLGETDFNGQLEARIREFVPGGPRLDAAEVEAHVRAYHDTYAGQWCAYDDVPDFLARLAAAQATRAAAGNPLRVAYLTNGSEPFQREKLAAVDALVPGWPVLASVQLGMAKPDPGIFLEACARLEVEPEQALMIGDDAWADIDGARRAGVPVIYLRRDAQAPAREVTTVSSLAQIRMA